MNSFEQKININPKIENIKTPEGNEVSVSPERGGIITSLMFKGKEVLYLDQDTFNNKEQNVKGGIPILFPNAGPIPDEIKIDELKDLKQHGFGRESVWSIIKTDNGFKSSLNVNHETLKIYPYNFKVEMDNHFEDDGSFTIVQSVTNLENEKEINISTGLHPYFKVPQEEKKNIKFNFKGGNTVEEQIEKWANGKSISIENPNEPIEVDIPGLGKLIFTVSKDYQRIWVWSQEGKDFVCIEPVMRDKGGIITDPEKVKPGETHMSSFNVKLENYDN